MVMASLVPGVLIKLLQSMGSDKEIATQKRTPLLQIISIIPLISGHDLWPNQGFNLKVSDSLHATYVSIPQEYDETILSDKLQLGQFIYVQKLELVSSVPTIKGLRLIPGRHPCIGNPKDLIIRINSKNAFIQYVFDSPPRIVHSDDSLNNLVKPRSSSASKIGVGYNTRRKEIRFRSGSTSPMNCLSRENTDKRVSDIISKLEKITITCVDEDSDSDSSRASWPFRAKAPRRSWHKGTTVKIKERHGSGPIKHENKPLFRTRSVDAVHSQTAHSTEGDHGSCFTIKRGDTQQTFFEGNGSVDCSWSTSVQSSELPNEDDNLQKDGSFDHTLIGKSDEPALNISAGKLMPSRVNSRHVSRHRDTPLSRDQVHPTPTARVYSRRDHRLPVASSARVPPSPDSVLGVL